MKRKRKASGFLLAGAAGLVAICEGAWIARQQAEYTRSEATAELLLELVENSETAFVVIDAAGVVEVFSAGAERMFNVPRLDIIGKDVTGVMPEDVALKHLQGFAAAVDANEPAGTTSVVFCDCPDTPAGPVEIQIEVQRVAVSGRDYWTGRINDRQNVKLLGAGN